MGLDGERRGKDKGGKGKGGEVRGGGGGVAGRGEVVKLSFNFSKNLGGAG